MAIVKMSKISLIGLAPSKGDIIKELMNLSAVDISTQEKKLEDEEWCQLVSLDNDEAEGIKIEGEILKTHTVLDVLGKYYIGKKPLFKTRRTVEHAKFRDVISRKADLEEKINSIYELSEQLTKFKNEENRIHAVMASLNPWIKYDLPLEIEGTAYTANIMGVLPAVSNMGQLLTELEQQNLCCDVSEASADVEQRYLSVIYYKQEEEAVMTLLKQYGFNRTVLKDMVGTVSQNLTDCTSRLAEITALRGNIEEQIRKFTGDQSDIEMVYDDLVMKRDQSKIVSCMLKTDHAFYLDGYVPAGMGETVKQKMEKYDCVITITQPEPDEECPVLMESGGLVTPFQAITNLYSTPLYQGIDPTPFFSIFYFIFFGIMLGDAGYGIIMTLGCFLLLKKYRLEGMIKKLITMFMYCGISTIFWGAMFGGWFSNIVTVVGKTYFQQELWGIKPLWFDPVQNPMQLLMFSFALGLIHLFLGMGLKAYMLIKRGKVLDALFDVGFWYLLLIGLILLLAGSAVLPAVFVVGKWMSIAGALGIILTGGRDNKNIFGRLMSGVLSLYNVTGYLGDVLSYSRLLGLGLAGGVIGSVINTMGALGGNGFVGVIVMVIVFIGGHTFNIAINALGSFVHTSRLQYVEFFGKFFEGGGKVYQPFKKSTKYIDIV